MYSFANKDIEVKMKIYIDKVPKDCWECPCFKNDIEMSCGLDDGIHNYFKDEIDGGKCPIISIRTHDRRVVKKVCEIIRENIEARDAYELDIINRLAILLDKIEKEFEE